MAKRIGPAKIKQCSLEFKLKAVQCLRMPLLSNVMHRMNTTNPNLLKRTFHGR